jgi:hypothetical protein
MGKQHLIYGKFHESKSNFAAKRGTEIGEFQSQVFWDMNIEETIPTHYIHEHEQSLPPISTGIVT